MLFIVVVLFSWSASAQIETSIFDNSVAHKEHKVPFFTNRPIVVNKDNSFSFKNSSTEQTNTLYFCSYDFETDSIALRYRAINLSNKYPCEKIKNNIFYDMYEYNRLERDIKNFYFIVGGYGKSFKKQVNGYMQRLKTTYGDTLFNKALIVVFAWGTEDKAFRYYNALKASKRGAADFAIFQHMLDEFISDDEYFETFPKDFTIDIMFSSMGNELFRNYLIKRERQNIPLVKTYNNISFVGSVAPRNEFEKGQAFHNLNEMADSVHVFVNSKDYLLKLSSVAHLKSRMGNKGPKHPEELAKYINVLNIKNMITLKDMSGMGHDYILTNPIVQDGLLQSINNDVEDKSQFFSKVSSSDTKQ